MTGIFFIDLVIEILQFIWNCISFIFRFILKIFEVFIPEEFLRGDFISEEAWGSFLGIVAIFGLSFALRKNFGGFFRAFFSLILIIIAGAIMLKINLIGLIITAIFALLAGFNAIKLNRWIVLGLAIMWLVMIVTAV